MEFEKITLENEKILKRLQKKTATYSVERWDNEFAKNVKYRELKSENPYEFGKGQEQSILERHRMSTATESMGFRNKSNIDPNTGAIVNTNDVNLPRIGTGGDSIRGS